MFGMHEDDGPTRKDVGKFIPESELQDWWKAMQAKYPDVFGPEEVLYEKDGKGHVMGTKLLAFFDDDQNKPMRCEVQGSKWVVEFGTGKTAMYVVTMGGELRQINLTAAHEEGGWAVE